MMKEYSESRLTRDLLFDLYIGISVALLPFFILFFMGVLFYDGDEVHRVFENGELVLASFFVTSTLFIMNRKHSEFHRPRMTSTINMLNILTIIIMFTNLMVYTFIRMNIFVDVSIRENVVNVYSITTLFVSVFISITSRYFIYKFGIRTLRNDAWYIDYDDADFRTTNAAQKRLIENLPAQVAEYVIREIKINPNVENKSQISPISPNAENKSQNSKLFQTQIRELFHSLMTPVTTVNDAIKLINISKSDEDFDKTLTDGLESINRNLSLISALLYAYRGLALLDFCTENSGISINTFITEAVKSLNNQHDKKTSVSIMELSDNIEGFSTEFVIALFLPLLQNAVEASPHDGTISITETKLANEIKITIENKTTKAVSIDELQKHGFTTKQNYNETREGIGLPAVRHIAKELQIRFEMHVEEWNVFAILYFPKRLKLEEA